MTQENSQEETLRREKMAITDPARELVDTLTILQNRSEDRGDIFLAERFEVEAWSGEFYHILFHISNRVDEVCRLTSNLEMDEEEIAHTVTIIAGLKEAFGANALQNPWKTVGYPNLAENRLQALRGVSFLLRRQISYPKLSEQEIGEIKELVVDLITWLREHQMVEQDFIRAALIDGLVAFDFRLQKVSWLGWGYTLECLRMVIGAYFALERAELNGDPNYEAILRRCASGLKTIFERMKTVKDVVDIGKLMLTAYGGFSLLTGHPNSVAGLLEHMQ